ncbi:uncharacterized protein LOC106162183 isoform X1 [Lingula anatina]|uniref:Uncharacterized protein LOC106162183 isoform X1 n=1 Tax=Lingula anatina TaxID=7574 RepID=A0A1S3IBM7_LINAN|nr:uncharacterized protein LOC106162183 isoform X1 [Lingula anatina]|eukprot:XP_013394819.1 uncharacterized protein LOC106162183 isoform X1 [Lingula anatina]
MKNPLLFFFLVCGLVIIHVGVLGETVLEDQEVAERSAPFAGKRSSLVKFDLQGFTPSRAEKINDKVNDEEVEKRGYRAEKINDKVNDEELEERRGYRAEKINDKVNDEEVEKRGNILVQKI